ncbi:MAG: flagellar biosynthesis protein FlhF [Candidatus Manganitrophus sp. SB1]|nr:flagellar biosynthesis protein FlhF [Candidatus Manganitrophus morganii]
MQIKKYEVFEIAEALQAIKKEMGPDAVILSTREIRKGDFGLLGRPMIEVTAAVDPPSPMQQQRERRETEERSDPVRGERSRRDVSTGESKGFGDLLEEAGRTGGADPAIGSVLEELRAVKESIEALRKSNLGMREELSAMKSRSHFPIPHTALGHPQSNDLHPTLTAIYRRLVLNGVDQTIASDLLQVMKRKLGPEDLWKEDFVENYLKEMIKGMAQAAVAMERPKQGGKVVALIGPTGVGKTTTVAKLAAHHFRKKGKVTLATLDTYRIGAVEQLKIYAKIIGAPVVVSEDRLKEAVARRQEGELILIDTAGRSHLNASQLESLAVLSRIEAPVETHLVLSSNTRERDLEEIIDRFSAVPISYFLFTKTDETRNYGSLLTAMRRKGKPLSYLTMGQRVPEDIEVATPKRIADLVLN